jgi:O-antigen/teichoic acid export membrane protein
MASTIKTLAVRSTVWTLIGYGASQILRLGGNLVLTRLLVPEMFGLMALVQVYLIGLNLFSDIGIGLSIIQNKHGEDPAFLNTAWTIQVVRGFSLWICSLILAWPLAKFYGEPSLAIFLPVVSLSCILSGFNSTGMYTLNRKLLLGKLTVMELVVQVASLIIMVGIAFYNRTIWALVSGGLIASFLKMVWSHFLEENHRNRFAWNKTAIREIVSFGKWIFVSTAMTFLASQADRIILGKLFTLKLLGVYSIAAMMSEVPKQIVSKFSSNVMFPVISSYSHLPLHELRDKVLQKRRWLLWMLASLLLCLTCFGDLIINGLYDDRYQQAEWMLPLLALGMWPLLLHVTIDPCLFAVGKPKYVALGNLLKFFYMLIVLPSSYALFGNLGAVVAIALNDIPIYAAVNFGLYREEISGLKQDLIATIILCVVLFVVLWGRYRIGFGLPLSSFVVIHGGK